MVGLRAAPSPVPPSSDGTWVSRLRWSVCAASNLRKVTSVPVFELLLRSECMPRWSGELLVRRYTVSIIVDSCAIGKPEMRGCASGKTGHWCERRNEHLGCHKFVQCRAKAREHADIETAMQSSRRTWPQAESCTRKNDFGRRSAHGNGVDFVLRTVE
jgi:hypothetical protein